MNFHAPRLTLSYENSNRTKQWFIGCAGYSLGCAGYTLGCAGYMLGCAGYTLGCAGYTLGCAGYMLGCAGYTLGCAAIQLAAQAIRIILFNVNIKPPGHHFGLSLAWDWQYICLGQISVSEPQIFCKALSKAKS